LPDPRTAKNSAWPRGRGRGRGHSPSLHPTTRPQQNWKVERSYRIDHEEFWSRHDFGDFARAADALRQWEHAYNHECSSLCRAVHPSRSSRPCPSHLQPQHRRNDHTNRRLTHGKWPVLTRRNAGARARREIRRLERWGCSGTGTCTVTLNGTMTVTASFSKGGKK